MYDRNISEIFRGYFVFMAIDLYREQMLQNEWIAIRDDEYVVYQFESIPFHECQCLADEL